MTSMLSVNQRVVLRLTVLGIATVLIQITAISQLELFSATADITPLVCAAVGLLMGSVTGAAFGFSVGVFADAALYQLMGISSLAFLAVGFAAGRLRELRDPQAPAVPMLLGAAATVVTIAAVGLMHFLLGMGAPISWAMLREVASTTILNALIALPVFSLVRRALTPILPDDPRRRRRRSYTTGGLSPLTRT